MLFLDCLSLAACTPCRGDPLRTAWQLRGPGAGQPRLLFWCPQGHVFGAVAPVMRQARGSPCISPRSQLRGVWVTWESHTQSCGMFPWHPTCSDSPAGCELFEQTRGCSCHTTQTETDVPRGRIWTSAFGQGPEALPFPSG